MYTSQGLMHAADYAEHLKDTDQGSTEIDVADWIYGHGPDWFDFSQPCPLDGEALWNHDSVTVADASGEVFACVYDGEACRMPGSEPTYI